MGLDKYDVIINGVQTTLLLSEADAQARGLTKKSAPAKAPESAKKAPAKKAAASKKAATPKNKAVTPADK